MKAYFVEDLLEEKFLTKKCSGGDFPSDVKRCTGYKHDAYTMSDGDPGIYFVDKAKNIFVASRMIESRGAKVPAVQFHGFHELIATRYFKNGEDMEARNLVKKLSMENFFEAENVRNILEKNNFKVYQFSHFEKKLSLWKDLKNVSSKKNEEVSEETVNEGFSLMKEAETPAQALFPTNTKEYVKTLKNFGIVGADKTLMPDGKPGKYAVLMDGQILVTTGDSDTRVHIFGKIGSKTSGYLAISRKKNLSPDDSRELVKAVASSLVSVETIEAVLKSLKFTVFDSEMDKFIKKQQKQKPKKMSEDSALRDNWLEDKISSLEKKLSDPNEKSFKVSFQSEKDMEKGTKFLKKIGYISVWDIGDKNNLFFQAYLPSDASASETEQYLRSIADLKAKVTQFAPDRVRNFEKDEARAYFVKLEKELDHPTDMEWVEAARNVGKKDARMQSFAFYLIKNILKGQAKEALVKSLRESDALSESIVISGKDIPKKFPFLPLVHNGETLFDGSDSEAVINRKKNLIVITWADIKSTSNLNRQDTIKVFGCVDRDWSVIGSKVYKRSDAAKKAAREIFRLIENPAKVLALLKKRNFDGLDAVEWKWKEIISSK